MWWGGFMAFDWLNWRDGQSQHFREQGALSEECEHSEREAT